MDRIIKRQEMICGSHEAEVRKYYPTIDEEGAVWLIADQPNMADNIYYCNFASESQGFAGRTLHFNLVDGEEIDLPAPWHTNSQALKHRCGIDITDLHLTYVVIAKNRALDKNLNTVYGDVVYEDKEPTLGYFKRGEHIAKELANKLNTVLYCYSESAGGSSDSPIYPDKGIR